MEIAGFHWYEGKCTQILGRYFAVLMEYFIVLARFIITPNV